MEVGCEFNDQEEQEVTELSYSDEDTESEDWRSRLPWPIFCEDESKFQECNNGGQMFWMFSKWEIFQILEVNIEVLVITFYITIYYLSFM